jgi:hypothetical protein
MAGLLDFLQAASNSAASSVSGPVDGLAWLLRQAGLDVGEPVGGSDWMQRQGLTRPVEPGLLGMAGETAGLLAPIAAAAKAPQIAKGLLQMGENAAAPRTLNQQTGAIVYHGSPHKFDKFDSSKIGTGEGAQAYGHGLYLAESPEVAGGYREKLSALLIDESTPEHWAKKILDKYRGDYVKAAEMAEALRTSGSSYVAGKEAVIQGAVDLLKKKSPLDPWSGGVYKVDLPDDAIAKMLDWDKPLHRQAPAVRKAVRAVVDESTAPGTYAQWVRGARPDFKTLQNDMLEGLGNAEISAKLRQAGIPGIRYLDGGSRGAGAGTSNYVVFPGEESLLKILERNGQGL